MVKNLPNKVIFEKYFGNESFIRSKFKKKENRKKCCTRSSLSRV